MDPKGPSPTKEEVEDSAAEGALSEEIVKYSHLGLLSS